MFERVYTMTDYHDGPREGVADFNGAPYKYRALFVPFDERDFDAFELSPLTPAVFALEAEAWAIWCRFEAACVAVPRASDVPKADWGALPDERARRRELSAAITAATAMALDPRVVCAGKFRARAAAAQLPVPFSQVPLEVEWTLVECDAAPSNPNTVQLT